MSWVDLEPAGDTVPPRSGAAAIALEENLVMFGGTDGPGSKFNDVCVLNLRFYPKCAWKVKKTMGQTPAPRSGHTCDIVNKTQMVVCGGDPVSGTFCEILDMSDIEQPRWKAVETKGRPPPGRYGHASAAVAENNVWVFAGHNGTTALNDVHVLDTDSMMWKQPKLYGKAPPPGSKYRGSAVESRGGAATSEGSSSTAAVGVWRIFMVGNPFNELNVINVASMAWEKPHLAGSPPPDRIKHAVSLVRRTLHHFRRTLPTTTVPAPALPVFILTAFAPL
jgi:hypothetical protein